MDTDQLANRLSDLASTAERLANEIYLDEDDLDERTGYRAQALRSHLGVALILAERLARQTDNDPMVTLDERDDGTGEARFEIALDETEFIDLEMQ